MSNSPKSLIYVVSLIGVSVLAAPSAFAVGGCSNTTLTGSYSAQISNASAVAFVNALNSQDPNAPLQSPPNGGFGTNPASLGGSVPGVGRFYFNGAGGILGQTTNSSIPSFTTIGSYSVNYDCTATLSLNGTPKPDGSLTAGTTFNAIVADAGKRVLFVETDASARGIVGQMVRGANQCGGPIANATTIAMNGAGVELGNPGFQIFATLASVTLYPGGTFSVAGWGITGGKVLTLTASGTYTTGTDCSLRLTFTGTPSAGVPGLAGIVAGSTDGVFSIQPGNGTTVTGIYVTQ